MEAGEELDLLVQSKVMGGPKTERFAEPNPDRCRELGGCDGFGPGGECANCTGLFDVPCPEFSRDDAASMTVVDEMVRRGLWVNLDLITNNRHWHVSLWDESKPWNGRHSDAIHPDRRVAICLAALQAIEHYTGRPA